jgi:capsular polysaccharide biosynthesis protein
VELKSYLNILKRRWPIVVLLPLLVALGALYQDATRDPQYSTDVRATVIRQPDAAPAGEFDYDRYYNYLASEFAIDDLVEAVRGNVFAEGVVARLPAGSDVSAGDVQNILAADRQHRILTMTATSTDGTEAELVARAAVEELEQAAFQYLGVEAIGSEAVVEIIQTPGAASPDTGRARLLLILQVVAALGTAVLLAFLIDYLDDTLYDAESTAAALRVPHLASVPGERQA